MESKQTVKQDNVSSKVENQKTLSIKSNSEHDSGFSSNYDSAVDCSETSASNITSSEHLSSHSLSDQQSKNDQNSKYDSGLGADCTSTLSEKVEFQPEHEIPEPPPRSKPLEWRDIFSQDKDGDTLLHLAIVEALSAVIFPIIRLAPHPDFLDITNDLYQAPLHLATLTSNPYIARRLVVAGATLDIQDHGGNTPLHIACRRGDLNCVESLLTRITQSEIDEANCLYKVFIQENNLSYLINMKNFEGLSSVHLAAAGGNKKVLEFLFNHDADINERDGKSGRTALHYAVENENLELVQLLLMKGKANPLVPNYAGQTAYSVACSLHKRNPSKTRKEISDLLKKHAEKFDSASEFEYDSSSDESDHIEASLQIFKEVSAKK